MRWVAFMAVAVCGIAGGVFASDSDVIDGLCARPWQVSGATWVVVRVFNPDGTFVTPGWNQPGTWQITADSIVLTFPLDGHTDTFKLPLDPKGTPGTDSKGLPTLSVRFPPEPRVVPPDLQQKATDIAAAHKSSLLVIAPDNGRQLAGPEHGFIATITKQNFAVVTIPCLVLARNPLVKTMDGAALRIGGISLAAGSDAACVAIAGGGAPFDVMDDVDKDAAAGDDVMVLTGTNGGVAPVFGQIVGIEPGRVEVNAPYDAGSDGCPIIHLKTGKVIGVVVCAYVTHDTANGRIVDKPVWRYGARLDKLKGWQAMNWNTFSAQETLVANIHAFTEDLDEFLGRPPLSGGQLLPGPISSGQMADNIAVWQSETGRNPNAATRLKANQDLVNNLQQASQADIPAVQRQITYDYFLRQLADEQKSRDRMAAAFKEMLGYFK